ncbi:MAG: NosD domain-containing protein [Candidatus Hodarchaeales archaeon]|jgi:parallel beta-helix repeat protein
MVNCPFCGKELETLKTAKFCTYCGSNLTSSVQKHIPRAQLSQKIGIKRFSPSYRPWLIIIGGIVTIGVIFISVILIGSYFLGSIFGPSLGSGVEIHSDADFVEYSSSGTGTSNDPYFLSNYYLTDQIYGFSIQSTTKHFIITNCTIEICYEGINIENVALETAKIFGNNITYDDCWVRETGPHAGITIHSSPGVNISNNLISNAGSEGILIENSKESFVSDNTISKQMTGIFLENSDSSVITNNSIEVCDEAIYCIESDYTNVTHNKCENNYYSFISIIGSNFVEISNNDCFNTSLYSWFSAGIFLNECSNCSITNNTIVDCYQGIYASSTSHCQIYYNLFENNSEYGVAVMSGWKESKSNTIYLNSFINNHLNGISQASDNGTSNYWFYFELEQGNFWSDWTGTGVYSIAGIANTSDIYPLSEPPV